MDLFNKCLILEERVPDKLNLAGISSINKKGNRRQCKNYRGLTNYMGRLYINIIKRSLKNKITEIEKPKSFHAGRSCTDNAFTLSQPTETRTI